MNVLQIKRGDFADLPTGANRLKAGEMYFAEDLDLIIMGKGDSSTVQFVSDGPTPIVIKKYVALLTQIGTNDPVATVLENNFSAEPVWTREGVGEYLLTFAGADQGLYYLTGNAHDIGYRGFHIATFGDYNDSQEDMILWVTQFDETKVDGYDFTFIQVFGYAYD